MQAARAVTQNAAITQGMDIVNAEKASLMADGHVILGVLVHGGRPVIELQASKLLARMADEGRGAYWMKGQDEHGPYRKGQLLDRACNVVWVERGI